jgi:hypothetical protein
MDEYCPDCVVKLKRDKKVLGKLSVWLKCPKCGFRKREESSYCINKELEEFEKRMKLSNLNENEFNEESYLE